MTKLFLFDCDCRVAPSRASESAKNVFEKIEKKKKRRPLNMENYYVSSRLNTVLRSSNAMELI